MLILNVSTDWSLTTCHLFCVYLHSFAVTFWQSPLLIKVREILWLWFNIEKVNSDKDRTCLLIFNHHDLSLTLSTPYLRCPTTSLLLVFGT